MTKSLTELASDIVRSQVGKVSMTASEISESLHQVFITLQEIQISENEGIGLKSSAEVLEKDTVMQKLSTAPKDSIQNDRILCLECGAEFRQLTQKHLSAHGISPKEYKKKYGFTLSTPLCARALTKSRSKAAKKRGLPENLQKFLAEKKSAKQKSSVPVGRHVDRARKVMRRFSPRVLG